MKYQDEEGKLVYVFNCPCDCPECTTRLFFYKQNPEELMIDFQINEENKFFKRAWKAIKYVFGWKKTQWCQTGMLGQNTKDLEDFIHLYNKFYELYDKKVWARGFDTSAYLTSEEIETLMKE